VERETSVPDVDGSIRHGKIEIPAVPTPFVPRPELRAELDRQADATDDGHVVLVSAGAGYGKTAAVADWVRASPECPTAWVRLDTGDRDEQQFWDSLLAALRACPGVPADSLLRTLTAAWSLAGSGSRTAFVAAVLNAVDALPEPVRLVLDDVHVLVAHPGLQGLHDLLAHRLPRLSLVLISRLDPPVGLHRLRLEGRLGEVRAQRLTFTSDQTTQLFAAQAPQLTPAQVSVLYDRTEGWVAALRLAVVSLRGREDPAGFVDEFAGDDRGVADYLIGEILGGLGERDRAVLDATSVCDTVTAELAVSLSGRDDAGEALESLEERTALLTPTDPHRIHYRAHDLLRSHILARLRRQHPAALAQLHLRAAEWHRERREHLEVVRYTALAGDPDATRAALRAHAVELIGRGQFSVVVDTIARVADDHGPDHRLQLVLAMVEIERGSVAVAGRLIDDAERHLGDDDGGDIDVFRRVVRTRRALAEGRSADALAAARTIRPDAAEGRPLHALALLTRGIAVMADDPDLARVDCGRALALADRHGWAYLGMQVLATLGALDITGPGPRTTDAARSADRRATNQGWQDSAWAVGAQLVLAAGAVMRCDPATAHAYIGRARESRLTGYPQLTAALGTIAGIADHDLGHRPDGWRRMRLARHEAGAVDLEDRQVAFAALLEHAAALDLDRPREAAEVLRWATGRLEGSGELALLQARQLWLPRREPASRAHLAPVLDGRVTTLLPDTVLAADLLDAEIALARGERTTARSRLDHALGLGADLDVLRPFTVAPDPIRRLIAEAAGGLGTPHRFIDRILAVEPGSTGALSAELTVREHAVLALLPTQRSVHEIAEDLTVSPNTVKTHLRAIYAKLGATSRREAVIRARHDQLIHSPPSGTQ
jgi:LuxR family maltose regulon positive regulatory protein